MPALLENGIEWVLMLTFPNGGSTAVAKMLLTAEGAVALDPRAEGQWLVPALSAPKARWEPSSVLDYDDIRTRWIEAARRAARRSADASPLVIEKSPPNMCRVRSIVAMLSGMKTDVIVLTRNPFATCASWYVRYDPDVVARDWGWVGAPPVSDAARLRALAEIWMTRARYLDDARDIAVHWMRYEDVADCPEAALAALGRKIPRLRTANAGALLTVKDYPAQTIRNMNDDQISLLSNEQRREISWVLMQDRALVARMGYDVDPPNLLTSMH